jgi:hypothetical protein
MRRRAAAVALFSALSGLSLPALTSPASADDCPLDLGHGTGLVLFSSQHMLAFRPDPIRIEVGQPFSLLLNVCTRRGGPAELLAVDSTMPEHKHGMNYAPTIVSRGDGRFRVEGMVFHMPGTWEVVFDVRSDGKTERLTHEIVLK